LGGHNAGLSEEGETATGINGIANVGSWFRDPVISIFFCLEEVEGYI